MNGRLEYRFNPAEVPTPAFVLDVGLMRDNLAILRRVRDETDCKILLALKAFAMYAVFPLLRETLDGVCASSPHEARLGREEFGGEVHTFAAAYSKNDIAELCQTADHIVFNSHAQLSRFAPDITQNAPHIKLGLRINPQHSEGTTPLYDPCSAGSRLGVRSGQFQPADLSLLDGLHWHNLCEQGADCLERTLAKVEQDFGQYFSGLEYVNFGGGHHITRPDYDVELLCRLIKDFKTRYNTQVYLEPGEAIVLNAGYLVTTVLDIVQADLPVAILDCCVPAHMPDVLEMPYRPHIVGSGPAGEKKQTCRLGGLSCLAGDIAGEYSFDAPLTVGQKLIFTDMAHYTMVKTNTFNGMPLPAILTFEPDTNRLTTIKTFSYQDFKGRLS